MGALAGGTGCAAGGVRGRTEAQTLYSELVRSAWQRRPGTDPEGVDGAPETEAQGGATERPPVDGSSGDRGQRSSRPCLASERPAADREAPHPRAESGGMPAWGGEGPAAAPGVLLWIRSPGEASAGLGGVDETRMGRVASRAEGSGPSPRGREGEARGRMEAGPWTPAASGAGRCRFRARGRSWDRACLPPACLLAAPPAPAWGSSPRHSKLFSVPLLLWPRK